MRGFTHGSNGGFGGDSLVVFAARDVEPAIWPYVVEAKERAIIQTCHVDDAVGFCVVALDFVIRADAIGVLG